MAPGRTRRAPRSRWVPCLFVFFGGIDAMQVDSNARIGGTTDGVEGTETNYSATMLGRIHQLLGSNAAGRDHQLLGRWAAGRFS